MTAHDETQPSAARLLTMIQEQQREIEQLKASRSAHPGWRPGILMRLRSTVPVSAALVLCLLVSGIAYADIPDNGVIHGCAVLISSANQYELRTVDTSAGQQCATGQIAVNWLPSSNAVNLTGNQTIGGTKGFSGRVGIGTSTPAAPLDVEGSSFYLQKLGSSSSTGTWLAMGNSSTGGKEWDLISSGSGNSEGTGKFLLHSNTSGNTDLIVDDSTGMVWARGGFSFPDGTTQTTASPYVGGYFQPSSGIKFPDGSTQTTAAGQLIQYRASVGIGSLENEEAYAACPSGQTLVSGGGEMKYQVTELYMTGSSPSPDVVGNSNSTNTWRVTMYNKSTSSHGLWVWAICQQGGTVTPPSSTCEVNCTSTLAKSMPGATIRQWTTRQGLRVTVVSRPLRPASHR